MKSRKIAGYEHTGTKTFSVRPKAFVFFDKLSRIYRFEVKACADGSMPVHDAASLLAMHCVMRGQTLKDFGVMVAVEDDLLCVLGDPAKRLIDACGTLDPGVELSPRQHEVLRGILQNLTNKEIAAQLRIGVRTVKFHVSALLVKFGVANRVSLAQKTGDLMSTVPLPAKLTFLQPAPSQAVDGAAVRNSRERQAHFDVMERRSHG